MLHNKVLITGGAGFIGSHITDTFLQHGFEVFIIDNLSSGNASNINSGATFFQYDILKDNLNSVFAEVRPDIVIHLAAQISVAESTKNPVFDAEENIIGTLKILNYCKKYGVKKIIVSSTAAVYGDLVPPLKEDMKLKPMSNYGISKLTMEKYVENSGIDYIICRFSNVYGERQTIKGEAGVVTIFENAMKNQQEITIYGDGNQVRDFIYVKDLAQILYKLIDKDIKNEIVNISTNIGVTINELFQSLAQKYSYHRQPHYTERRVGDIEISILDNSKLMKLIDYTFENSLKK